MNYEKIETPPVQALKALLNVSDENKKRWLDSFLKKSATAISADLMLYRSYGHYWWLLKSLFIKNGYHEFGDYMNNDFKDALCNADDNLDAVACWLYHNERVEGGLADVQENEISLMDGGTFSYVLVDDDIEISSLEK